jgi:hypothetical protein
MFYMKSDFLMVLANLLTYCSTPLNKLPFDVKTWKTISYKKGQTHALKGTLAKEPKELLKR